MSEHEISQEDARRMIATLERVREFATATRRDLMGDPSAPQVNQVNQSLAALALEIGVVLRAVRPSGPADDDEAELTARQRELLACVRDHRRRRGISPSIREIGDAMGIKSPNGVMAHIDALEKKGRIRREPNNARSITLT